MGTVMKIILYTQIYFILIYVKESDAESSKSYISKHDLVLEFLLPLNFTRGNSLATHKREERDIDDGSGDGDLDIIRRSSEESDAPSSSILKSINHEEESHNQDVEVFDEKLIQRSRSKENLDEGYDEGSGAEPEKNPEPILTPEEDPFTKDLEPDIVKKILGVESSTKSLDDDNSQDNTLNVLPNVKETETEEADPGDEGSGDEADINIGEKVEEIPENEIIDEEEPEDKLNSYILEKPLAETTTEAITEDDAEAATEEEAATEGEVATEAEEIATEVEFQAETTTEIEIIVESTTEVDEIVEITAETEETATEDTTTETISTTESDVEISKTIDYIEDSTTITPEETTTELFLNQTEDYSINATETPENILDVLENATLAIDPLLMAMDTKLLESDEKILMASREPKRLGAYIVIGLILLSFLSLIGYIALKKRITKRRKELENNQETKDTEKALLSLSEYKDHPDAEENNIKNNEITPIVIQNSQRNKFEKNTNFSSPKNLNTNANEKTIEKDNVLKSTSDNLTQVIIEDSVKEIDEELKENIPNTEKLIVRTHLDQDSIPKRAIIVNRTSGGYLPVSQDNNM